MIIGKREGMFKLGEVPKIEIHENGFVTHYKTFKWLPLMDLMLPLLRNRFLKTSGYNSSLMKQMIFATEFTLSYLCEYGLVKEVEPEFKEFKLWDEFIELGPELEGIRNGIASAVIKHFYPSSFNSGQVISHWGWSCINDSVMYVMEWFKKNNYLKERKK